MRRAILASAIAHGLAIVAMLWIPARDPVPMPGVVTVDLVALAAPAGGKPAARPASPRAAPAKPVPPAPKPAAAQAAPAAPEPTPEPPKPPPKPPPTPPRNELAIPKKPEREPEKPKAKPEPEPKPEPKREPEKPKEVAKTTPPKPEPPKEAAKPPAPKPAPPKQESYDDLLADLRAERGESRPDRVERPSRTAQAEGGGAAAPGSAAGRSGSPVSPENAGWFRAVQIHVGQAWMLSAEMRGRRLMTELLVDLDAKGNVLSEPRVVRGSGDARFDESAVRALRKASPLPAPPEPGVWPIAFCPECRG